ncbi:cysteine desulfurase family protein [Actinomyces vulturis]|uniref:cysteine desulfurase family protein n=1 Tax=Actinomyces vulturis TaxID=1857645 RepID=UPI001146C21F|nr:cysteine desulfurase family protein [Actinomyces vulturis]
MSTRTYLDDAASAPLYPEVIDQMHRDHTDLFANPSALHTSGRHCDGLLMEARERVAACLDAQAHEVMFMGGGTESDALVIAGRAWHWASTRNTPPVLMVSAVEHPAVMDSAKTAAALTGGRLEIIEVDNQGRVRLDHLDALLTKHAQNTALVSVMSVNNETGTIEPVTDVVQHVRTACQSYAETARAAKNAALPSVSSYGGSTGNMGNSGLAGALPPVPPSIPVHTDAVAAAGRIPLSFASLGVDAMSITAHKIGGPVGIAALIAKRDLELTVPMGGGRQERGIRSGTHDVVGARALALALEISCANRDETTARLSDFCQQLRTMIASLPGVHATITAPADHSPAVVHCWCDKADGQALIMALDMAGIDTSAGSACHAGVPGPSEVLVAMGYDDARARSTVRFSMGPATTQTDIDHVLRVFPGALDLARGTWARTHR